MRTAAPITGKRTEAKPRDLAYRASYERTRFLSAASHVHRGQLLLDAGKLQEALTEFQKALAIDSSSFIAQQEIRHTQKLIDAVNAPPRPPPRPPAWKNAWKKRRARSIWPPSRTFPLLSNLPKIPR